MGQISTSGCGSGAEPRPLRLPCWGWMRAGGRCSGTGSNDDQAHDGKRGEARQRERARSSLAGGAVSYSA